MEDTQNRQQVNIDGHGYSILGEHIAIKYIVGMSLLPQIISTIWQHNVPSPEPNNHHQDESWNGDFVVGGLSHAFSHVTHDI
jgi:hypothetical protein